LDKGLLSIDDHGDVQMYPVSGGMEIQLGSVDSDGKFEVTPVFDVDENWTEELRKKVLAGYLGEVELYHETPQVQWDDDIVKWIDIENLPHVERETWTKLDSYEEGPHGDRRRYQDKSGQWLHGLYQNNTNALHLIQSGISMKSWELSSALEADSKTADRICRWGGHPWTDVYGEDQNFQKLELEEFQNGERDLVRIFLGRKKQMLSLCEELEEQKLQFFVKSHQYDKEKFMVTVVREVKLGDYLSQKNVEKIEVTEALKEHFEWSLKQWYEEKYHEAIQELKTFMDGLTAGVPKLLL
jgi:hypothetical protein